MNEQVSQDEGAGIKQVIEFAVNLTSVLKNELGASILKELAQSESECGKIFAVALSKDGNLLIGKGQGDTLKGSSGNDILMGADGNDILYGENGNDLLLGGAGNDTILGDEGNDVLYGEDGNDLLLGGAGNDTLYGGNGNDTLDGGAGDDTLDGGKGNDTYLISRNGGRDTIYDYDSTPGNVDTVRFTDVTSNEITELRKVGNNLEIFFAETRLVLKNHFSGSNYQMERFEFSDGVALSMAELYARQPLHGSEAADSINLSGLSQDTVIYGYGGNDVITAGDGDDFIDGGAGNDKLYGGKGNDTLVGGEGNDILYGEDGNDLLLGGAGNDSLYGGNGNDTLDGGAGDDYLEGGKGNDTYLISRDGGRDTIYDYDTTPGNVDTMRFTDVNSNEITELRKVGSNLEIFFADTSLVLKNHFSGSSYQVEKFEFADGVTCGRQELIELVGSIT